MSSHKHARQLIETLHAQSQNQDKLFQLIAALANCLDRDVVIETMKGFLGIEPIEKDGCVLFDDIAASFGKDGRVKSLYRVIDGTEKPAIVKIQRDMHG